MLLLWLGACALRTTAPTIDLGATLAEVDAQWDARAAPGGLDSVMERLLAALAASPDHPALLARLARGEWTRAQLGEGAVHFEIAQDYGYRCLLGWPGFASRLDGGGYRVDAAAAAELPAESAGCLTWTVASGLGQVEHRGPGAALELESLRALHGRLTQLGSGEAPGFTAWEAAKLELLSGGADSQLVRSRLAEAIAQAPGVLLFRVELAEAMPDAQNVAVEGFGPPASDAWALENAAWSARLTAP